MFDLDLFISKSITKRAFSMFRCDIEKYSKELYHKINNKSVLVIGGAGTIGSSFIKVILRYSPLELVVVDTNENALAELTRDLRSTKGMYIPKEYKTYPMDFASKVFKKMFYNHKGFDIIANFSAHKHVRSEKDIFSVEALIQNNVIHAKSLLDTISMFPPQVYFCVSTDKAANPVNIMGASKRIMEDLIFSYSDKFPVKTARFANVAFSNGSLPAGFLSRIQKLQPLSAPLDIKRYFVSPIESGEICVLSCILGNNREIFYPKLDEAQMMSFDKIAEDLLHTYGFNICYCDSDEEAIDKSENLMYNSNDYPVHFSKSDTSGEKSFEEFVTDTEESDLNRFSSLGVIINKPIPDKKSIDSLLCKLNNSFNEIETTKEDIVEILREYLPNFAHIETGKSLDYKM
ncbi:MAG: NAD-dependent epimerase/dehydratase family protein [Pseudobutyrivibrio ruminis]|nr:NAD-dependent epimerase/dehydratase family protein [Pseudobutyrivibrio ruminis]